PGQPVPDIAAGVLEAVVVVPLEGGAPGAAVLDQGVGVGLRNPLLFQQITAGGAGGEPLGELAVEEERLGRGHPARLAVEGGAAVAPVQVDAEVAGALRQ